jgi:hypothetical protein
MNEGEKVLDGSEEEKREGLLQKIEKEINLSEAKEIKNVINLPNGSIAIYHHEMIYCNTGGWARRKPWAAEIIGYDPKFVFARNFLKRQYIGNKIYQVVPRLPAIVQFHGGSTKNDYKSIYYIFKKDEKVYAIELGEKFLLEKILR